MPLVETDEDPKRADELTDQLEDSPSILSIYREEEDVRGWSFGILVGLVGIWGVTDWVLSKADPGIMQWAIFAIIASLLVFFVFDLADNLACVLTERHDCRHCEDELDRWEGDS